MTRGADAAEGDLSIDVSRTYRLFEALRWPDGPQACPHCGRAGRCRFLSPEDGIARATRTGTRSARRVWRCGHCRRQFSVLTGTIFEGTRVPLPVWLDAVTCLSGYAPSTWPDAVGLLTRSVDVSSATARAMTALMLGGIEAAGAQPQG